MCAQLESVPCPVQIVLVRHVLERERNSNTGRLVARALAGAQILDYASPQGQLDTGLLRQPGTALLYPQDGGRSPEQPPTRLLVLDASWSQARRMTQRIPALRGLPRLTLPAPRTALPRLRRGRGPEQMSTAESVVVALRALGHEAPADHLESLLRELVRRFALPQRRGPQGDCQ